MSDAATTASDIQDRDFIPYLPKVPVMEINMCCNKCIQIFHNIPYGIPSIDKAKGKTTTDIGPTFDGTTIIHCRFEDTKSGRKFHYYNGLSPEPLCRLVPKMIPEGTSKTMVPFDFDREWTFRVIEPPPPESPAPPSLIGSGGSKETPLVFTILKFIIGRMTRVAPQNEGVMRKNKWGMERIAKPELKKSQILIGGSFALHVFQTMFEKAEEKPGGASPYSSTPRWDYNDVDIFFLGRTSGNRYHIRQTLLRYILGSMKGNDWVTTFKAPSGVGRIPSMDFVRTDCETVEDFMEGIDISITEMVIVHKSAELPDGSVVIGEVEYLREGDDQWFLVSTPGALEDVKLRRQRYHRKIDHPLFSKCLRRVAKYWERGFQEIIHEPKEVSCAIGGYNVE